MKKIDISDSNISAAAISIVGEAVTNVGNSVLRKNPPPLLLFLINRKQDHLTDECSTGSNNHLRSLIFKSPLVMSFICYQTTHMTQIFCVSDCLSHMKENMERREIDLSLELAVLH